MKKKFKLGLLPQVLVAITLGILLGDVLPDWCVRIFITFYFTLYNRLQFHPPH